MSEKVSVAMAVYNGAKYLEAQIGSILPQLKENDELVISYDESSDDTLDFIRCYEKKDPRIKIIYDPGHGVTDNFSNAISNCKGDYIFLSDQDDIWLDKKVEMVMQCFHEKEPDLIVHNSRDFDDDTGLAAKSSFEKYRTGPGKLKNCIRSRCSGCCMAFTREMIDLILPIPVDEGYDHWISALGEFCGSVSYIDEELLHHRLHVDNVTPAAHRSLPVVVRSRILLLQKLINRAERARRKG